MELEELAEQRPLFTLNEAERATGIEREYLREKLSRKTKKGELYRVERGKYTAHEDSMIYATHVRKPSYISLWSGLRYYNLTTQQPTKIQVITGSRRKNLEKIEFYYSSNMFGYWREQYQGFEITVAEKERLLIDILNKGEVPVDETRELVEEIEISKAVSYADRLDKNSVKKRLGFLIEEIRNQEIGELRVKDRNYNVLDLTKSEEGKNNPRWYLKVNNDAF